MAKKKLLSETQVRRFMGLAGMQPITVSNYLKEGDWAYNRGIAEEEEVFPPEDEPAMDAGPEEDLPQEEPPMDDEEPDVEMPGEDVEVGETEIQAALDALSALEALVQPLASAAGLEAGAPEGGEEMGELPPELDMGGEELPPPEDGEEFPPPEEEEDVFQEALSEINLGLSKDEIINEVAKRVAQRILRAKKAQKAMNEALGNKTKK